MHKNSMDLMTNFRDKYLSDMKGCAVIDVGAMRVFNLPSYRRLFEPDYRYVGMDVVPGKNVDIVGYENISEVYDVVISGQVMEHVRRPWDWLLNLTKYFKTYICIVAPNTFREHRLPIDTYRYYPDGMQDLFDYAGITPTEVFKSGSDTIGIGTK